MQNPNDNCKDIKDTDPIQPLVKYIDPETNKMRWALTAITREIERFNYDENIESKKIKDFEILKKIFQYKQRIKTKKNQIKRLNQEVKIYYILVKLLISSKEKDYWNLIKTLNLIKQRIKRVEFIKNRFIKVELIRQLTKENDFFKKQFQNFQKYIYQVYNELPDKSIEQSFTRDAQLLEKIKAIIFDYEQQNIIFCTERRRCQLIEQKNRFLKNKINILECNIESLKEELESLTYQLLKRDRKITFYKNKLFNKINDKEVSTVEGPPKMTSPNKSVYLQQHKNLSSHLALVNTLLIDQDTMISNLKCISNHIYTNN